MKLIATWIDTQHLQTEEPNGFHWGNGHTEGKMDGFRLHQLDPHWLVFFYYHTQLHLETKLIAQIIFDFEEGVGLSKNWISRPSFLVRRSHCYR